MIEQKARKNYRDEKWIGEKFGRLTVQEILFGKEYTGKTYWKCRCDCGNTTIKGANQIITGHVVSCGCAFKEYFHNLTFDENGKRNRLHIVWTTMRSRCNNYKDRSYHDYGGRGIKVCEEWNRYPAFYEWAMENGYDKDAPHGQCTLDRIDNDGNYEPSNCRWATMKEQVKNKRRNGRPPKDLDLVQILLMRMEGKTYSEIGAKFNTTPTLIYSRMQSAIKQNIGSRPN